jgi:predicted protein tyrosine phosphatase
MSYIIHSAAAALVAAVCTTKQGDTSHSRQFASPVSLRPGADVLCVMDACSAREGEHRRAMVAAQCGEGRKYAHPSAK